MQPRKAAGLSAAGMYFYWLKLQLTKVLCEEVSRTRISRYSTSKQSILVSTFFEELVRFGQN